MGMKVVRMTGEFLTALVRGDAQASAAMRAKVPANARVIGISDELWFDSDEWGIKFESPDFEEVPPAHALRQIKLG